MFDDPIAYFITWTCYGTWLPGDDRGWTQWHKGDQVGQPLLADWCRKQMVEEAIYLNDQQRKIVNTIVVEHCTYRKWQLHAVNCRSNHCHVVVSAPDYSGEIVRDQLKAWSTRKLNEQQHLLSSAGRRRERWWTRKGSIRHLFDEESLDASIIYTLEAQEFGGSKMDFD
jgi:REP element-mobilizing transposase RayT